MNQFVTQYITYLNIWAVLRFRFNGVVIAAPCTATF
jgi:hypothetical protein